MRDHLGEIHAAGAARVIGMSGQSPEAQAEAHERLHLPFPLVSDQQGRAAAALQLPTFDLAGRTYLRRLTMVVRECLVEHVFYPVFPPDTHAHQVIAWLRTH